MRIESNNKGGKGKRARTGTPALIRRGPGAAVEPLESRRLMTASVVVGPTIGNSAVAGIAVGDLNGDGLPDFVNSQAFSSLATIQVWMGTGAGGFTPGTNVQTATGTEAYAVSLIDVNGDGKIDLLDAHQDGTLGVFLGKGDGTFAAEKNTVASASGGAATVLATGDFNNDGKVDVAVGATGAGMRVLFGDGAGNFATGFSGADGGSVSGIVALDFNHDGVPDIAWSTRYGANVYILSNLQTASPYLQSFNLGISSNNRFGGGFTGGNGGVPAFVMCDTGNNVVRLIADPLSNNGLGATYTAGQQSPSAVTLTDLDGDGAGDLVIAQQGGNIVTITPGTSSPGGFVSGTTSYTAYRTPSQLAVGDFDGDGVSDVGVGFLGGGGGTEILENTGQSLVVNSTSGVSDGSSSWHAGDGLATLPDVLNYAQTLSGPVKITFDPTVFKTPQSITLNSTLRILNNSDITIVGPAAGVTISGNNAQQVMTVATGSKLTLKGLTVANGLIRVNSTGPDGIGGGIENSGTLVVNGCTFTGNRAYAVGSAIGSLGTLSITDSTFSGNSFLGNVYCGTIGIVNGTATVNFSTIAANAGGSNSQGAGVSVVGGSLAINDSIVSQNTFGYDLAAFGGGTISGNNDVVGTSVGGSGPSGVITANPLLSPLANNGGPTATMAIGAGSSALNAGYAISGITTDQRGVARHGSPYLPDIGAYEFPIRSTIQLNGSSTVPYTGDPVGSPVVVKHTDGTTDSPDSVTYYTDNGSTTPIPAPTNIGSYLVRATYGVRGNYPAATTATLAFSIGQGNPTITFTGGTTIGYTGAPVAITATVTDSKGASVGTAVLYFHTATDEDTNIVPPTDIGNYTVAATFYGNALYRAYGISEGFSIVKGTTTVTVAVPQSVAYGTTPSPTGTVVNQIGTALGTPTLTYYNAADTGLHSPLATVPTAVGNYLLVGTYPGTANYNSSTSTPQAFSIVGGLVVTSTDDKSSGNSGNTLRSAIAYARSLGGNQIVSFTSGLSGTITLSSALSINDPGGAITIAGPGARVLAVSGNNAFNVFTIAPGAMAEIDGLTITKGAANVGAGIANSGSLTVNNDNFAANNAAGGGGGAIFTSGLLLVNNCSFVNNSANGNDGGAIQFYADPSTNLNKVTNCTFVGNSATEGTIWNGNGAVTYLYNDTIVGNAMGITNYGTLTVTNTIAAGNTGYETANSGTMNVSRSVFGSSGTGVANGVNGNLTGVSTSSLFGSYALGYYGGTTQTMPLATGSPAIGAGVAVTGVATDQRGFPLPGNNGYDIGAYQSDSSYYLKRSADGVHANLWTNATGIGASYVQFDPAGLTGLTLVASGGAGSVTVDESAGNFLPAGGISVAGTASTTLKLIGTGTGDAVVSTAGQLKINGFPVSFGGIGPISYEPNQGVNSLNVAGGALAIAAPPPQVGITGRVFSVVQIGNGASLSVTAAALPEDRSVLTVGALQVAGSAGAWQGKLDLNGSDLIVQNGSLSQIQNLFAGGYNQGAWNGQGIANSAAANDPNHLKTLGVELNTAGGQRLFGDGTAAGRFDDQNPASADVLIKSTYYGDANLDGKVDGSDYSRIDGGFLTHASTWAAGDLNVDGVVDGSDYTLIDNAFNRQSIRQAPLFDFGAGFNNAGGSIAANGNAAVINGGVQLTSGSNGQLSSVYVNTPLSIARFHTRFLFTVSAGPSADGFTFTIQNNASNTVGLGGGSLGYEGIGNSIAVKFDLYDNAGEGTNSTGLYRNGAVPQSAGSVDLTATGINLHAGNPILADVTYNGSALTVVLTDTVTAATATQTYAIDIASTIGSPTAYFGFTAATGGVASIQTINGWTIYGV